MSDPTLMRFARKLSEGERADAVDGREVGETTVIERPDGSNVQTRCFDDLMADFELRKAAGTWERDRAEADRWLAPRVHFALRLDRKTASDRSLWEWLAVRHAPVVTWRWRGFDGSPPKGDRWYGPVHKQAFARLWWGAELFRDGDNYRPVERAFVRQDLINSYLHRPVVRCRSLALGILEVLTPEDDPKKTSAGEVNDLARVLNLATAGAPPELETGMQQDDYVSFRTWSGSDAETPSSWDELPSGPQCADTTPESVAGGTEIARRGWSYAVPDDAPTIALS